MKKKLLFVFNPKSGKGLIKEHLVNIVDIMTKAGYKITIYPTQCQGDAIKKVRKNAEKYDLVVCSGGDGTLDEVVTGMEQSEVNVPIGYIPAGSTNDFANSLGIPKNMEEAARVAVNGTPFPCDVPCRFTVYCPERRIIQWKRFCSSSIKRRLCIRHRR